MGKSTRQGTDLSRRHFLKTAAWASFAASAGLTASSKARALETELETDTPLSSRPRGKRVAILGGGVGGMTAAHELAERGFEVDVFEMKDLPGGKARSIPVPDSGRGGRMDLPGEHGFRFFPGFYFHLDHTMKRIPYGSNAQGTYDNLVSMPAMQFGRVGEPEIVFPARLPQSADDIRGAINFVLHSQFGVPREDAQFFARKLLQLLTSCEARRYAEYENISWWNFIEAGTRSENFRRFIANGLMRCLVACQPRLISTRTGGYIFLQLLLSLLGQNTHVDRILNGPTNDVFIFPWLTHLQNMGVRYHYPAHVNALHFTEGEIDGITVSDERGTHDLSFDHYVLAVPCEVAARLIPESMKAADPALSRIADLRVEWMNGIQFYLKRDALRGVGHTMYFDSQWAITSISQKQFWENTDLTRYGDGTVQGILSVDVSDWNTPGILYGKPAKRCSRDEVIAEVWAQIKNHLNDGGQIRLRDDDLIRVFVDPGIRFPGEGAVGPENENDEPLLINTVGSWFNRPPAVSRIANFYMASDYVQSYSDLACMEAANEAARRAVNGILAKTNTGKPPCAISPLQEPSIFAPWREYDRIRFERGQPWDPAVLERV